MTDDEQDPTMRRLRRRFWLEVALGAALLLALIMTRLSPEWIEELFGVSPDGGSGALEWLVVGVLAVATSSAGLLAHREWRRPRRAANATS